MHRSAIRDVTPAVREFCCGRSRGAQPYAPGSHINVGGDRRRAAGDALAIRWSGRRALTATASPCSARRESRGGSRYMWWLKPGARLEISSPASLFELDWAGSTCA